MSTATRAFLPRALPVLADGFCADFRFAAFFFTAMSPSDFSKAFEYLT
jgi:hypothetical protein